ncbi:10072_t:CDS:2 [Diversispora eburnea]|uniref:10072_t:CDS:1 n=1 Tax=Diversispora eburnea TaxID=1213867 RepID=A0A9N8W9K5_9GLOM|nr:10072_t:CDS:2 [Diversispora eburnea]
MYQLQKSIKITEITTAITHSFIFSPMRTLVTSGSNSNSNGRYGNKNINFIRNFFSLINKNNNKTINKLKYKPMTAINFNFRNRNNMCIQPRRYYNEDTNAASVFDPFPIPGNPLKSNNKSQSSKKSSNSRISLYDIFSPRVRDAVLTTVMGLAAVGLGGVLYQYWYEWHEVHKVLKAFTKSTSVLKSKIKEGYFARDEYDKIFSAIGGEASGKYYLLVGENGTGKTQLVFKAMENAGQNGVVFCEAHSNAEIFKTRLGKALNYTFREDYVGGLFAREAPERGSALLDVERALNIIEEVAYIYKRRHKRPLVLIINNVHSFKDDEDGSDLLELLQQRAEYWATGGFVTMVFNTDDYYVYERMKMDANKMEVIRVHDLEHYEAVRFLKDKRGGHESEELLYNIVSKRIGGRVAHLNLLAEDPTKDINASQIEDTERTWLTNKVGLIPNFEGSEEFESQKYAVAAWKLFRAIVKSPTKSLSLTQGRNIIGNPRYLQQLDHDGIIMVDTENNVKPDSQISCNYFEDI